jgi:integrase
MLFRLASPMRRSGSSIPQFVQRIPVDVRQRAIGMRLAIPLGDQTVSVLITEKTTAIRFSLRTDEKSVAKVRQAEAIAYLEQVWGGLRANEPVALSQRQATALAGELYRSWADTQRPVRSRSVTIDKHGSVTDDDDLEGEEAGLAYEATIAMLDRVEERGDVSTLEPMFGALIDKLLIARGIPSVTAQSRRLLLEAFWLALRDAMEVQRRGAGGDFSPDPKAGRFPEWVPPNGEAKRVWDASNGSAKVSLKGLLESWWTESKATGLKERTYKGYRTTIVRLTKYLRHDDATRVTPSDIVAFKDHRLASIDPRSGQHVSARTVKDSDLAALKSVFGWAARNHKLPSNPADGITIKLGKRRKTRESGFRDEEVKALLSACIKLTQGNDRPETYAAKRWIPWLLAYTGARVGEIAQLRKQDVQQAVDHWRIVITPEAGTVKSNEARQVPLHPHLIEQGFVEFVKAAPDGYLFLRPNSKTGDVLGPMTGVKNRVREFVREFITDPNVQPNHAWRHLFITRSRAAGVDQELRRMITGHSGAGVDERVYGDPAGLYREICKLPRFPVA